MTNLSGRVINLLGMSIHWMMMMMMMIIDNDFIGCLILSRLNAADALVGFPGSSGGHKPVVDIDI